MAGADAHDGPHRRTQRGAETRAAMVLVAERLFAEQGINAVSLREVGRAANQKNRSVTQYYFGSREAMIDAVLEHRLGPINRERASMVRAVELSGRSRDLRSLLEALVVPAVETLGSSGYWFRFAAQLVGTSGGIPARVLEDRAEASAVRELLQRVHAALGHLDASVRIDRTRLGFAAVAIYLAGYEARVEQGEVIDPAFVATALVDVLIGMLRAEDHTHAVDAETDAETGADPAEPGTVANPD